MSTSTQHTTSTTLTANADQQADALPTQPGTDENGVVWKRAPEPFDDYLVSTSGRVVSLKGAPPYPSPYELSGTVVRAGYRRVRLSAGKRRKKLHLVHRLVWKVHQGPIPPKWRVRHLDGDRLNNALSNLEALSARDHVIKHSATISEDEAAAIKHLCRVEEVSVRTVADMFGISYHHAWEVSADRTWSHVDPAPPNLSMILEIQQAD